MPRKPATVDDIREPISEDIITADYHNITLTYHEGDSLATLLISGVVTGVTDGTITWRAGHLEHIANLYKGDPQATARDYADDLAVARAYSADVWERLTNG